MSRLPMQDDEIANSYRLAKDPEAQVIVLAELNGTSPENIRRILVEREVYVPVYKPRESNIKKRPWTEEENREALRMSGEGISRKEIAAKLGRSEGAVSVQIVKLKKSGGKKMETKKKPVQEKKQPKEETDAGQQDIIIRSKPGGIAHLATMMSVLQKWIVQGSEVTLHSVETDENGGVMIAVVDGLMVYAEVPIR